MALDILHEVTLTRAPKQPPMIRIICIENNDDIDD